MSNTKLKFDISGTKIIVPMISSRSYMDGSYNFLTDGNLLYNLEVHGKSNDTIFLLMPREHAVETSQIKRTVEYKQRQLFVEYVERYYPNVRVVWELTYGYNAKNNREVVINNSKDKIEQLVKLMKPSTNYARFQIISDFPDILTLDSVIEMSTRDNDKNKIKVIVNIKTDDDLRILESIEPQRPVIKYATEFSCVDKNLELKIDSWLRSYMCYEGEATDYRMVPSGYVLGGKTGYNMSTLCNSIITNGIKKLMSVSDRIETTNKTIESYGGLELLCSTIPTTLISKCDIDNIKKFIQHDYKNSLFFPMRASDPAYDVNRVIELSKQINKTLYVTDPNHTFEKFAKEAGFSNYVIVRGFAQSKELYYSALMRQPMIPYFEDPSKLFHPGFLEMVGFKVRFIGV